MSEDYTPTLAIDPRRTSYCGFLDLEWVNRFLSSATGTPLYTAAMDLCAEWKSTNNTFRMPSVLLQSLESYHDGFTRTRSPLGLRFVKALADYVLRQPGMNMSRTKERLLREYTARLAAAMRARAEENRPEFAAEPLWQALIENIEFASSVWSSQRMCYATIYYAYENFLRRCVAAIRTDESYRIGRRKEWCRDLEQALGGGASSELLDDDAVNAARLIRHALAHNGGRSTAELGRYRGIAKTGPDNSIVIMPKQVRALYDLLKGKAENALGRAVRHLIG